MDKFRVSLWRRDSATGATQQHVQAWDNMDDARTVARNVAEKIERTGRKDWDRVLIMRGNDLLFARYIFGAEFESAVHMA